MEVGKASKERSTSATKVQLMKALLDFASQEDRWGTESSSEVALYQLIGQCFEEQGASTTLLLVHQIAQSDAALNHIRTHPNMVGEHLEDHEDSIKEIMRQACEPRAQRPILQLTTGDGSDFLYPISAPSPLSRPCTST
jgi:hypothetical protein